ncbi:Uncharacterised protein [Mycobacteroides abscessus subsp. abscessus]|uniref:hypothetical protein n=1 Tax=Mycobacteroides abscessus TaxID=36809 RepID=UPI0009271AD1|nr:hypothetical protein [Mycobacteroides abscessus]SIC58041.1 Uncharacterised protein [Mycobacteroides abscessus subsp. abscessus]SIC89003.1 Uncharacterised protein [Mycobacteroides abscessus subsp. abscessus]SID09340.1 Uncharacterised protein [Mycobacteroides abscessus subsp. abscessus]SID53982.1 Uncharacterised protein [Mycobacteroides abscessus subsp. abscessus]SKT54407.1 Uncharacterised protein [Mycobacteroides abscessus subsp. abscessus]
MSDQQDTCDEPIDPVISKSVIEMSNQRGQDRARNNKNLNVSKAIREFDDVLADYRLPIGWYARTRLRRCLRAAARADRAFWSATPTAQANALNWYLGIGETVQLLLTAARALQHNNDSRFGEHSAIKTVVRCLRDGVASPGHQLLHIAVHSSGGWGNIRRQASYARSALHEPYDPPSSSN